jgi:hypothetical protein
MTEAFVFSTDALVVLYWTEYLGAEQTIALGFQRTIVNSLWLGNLTERPATDTLRACKRYLEGVELNWVLGLFKETKNIIHGFSLLKCIS